MAMTPEEQEKETRRRRVAQADLRFDTQALRLPEKFIEENKAENSGPLVEPAILVIFLIKGIMSRQTEKLELTYTAWDSTNNVALKVDKKAK